MADLTDRNQLAGLAGQGHVLDARRVQAFFALGASDHLDGANVLAHLSHRGASEQELKLLGRLGGSQADDVQTVLVQHEMHGGLAFAPVTVDLTHVGVAAHDIGDLPGDVAQLSGVRAHHTEFHGKARVRAKHQLRHAHAGFGGKLLLHLGAQPLFERIPGGLVVGQHDDLGERRIGQFRVIGQEESRRALADIAGNDAAFGLGLDPVLDLAGGFAGGIDGRALGKLDFHQQFRTVGAGKKLLLHRAHADDRQPQQAKDNPCHQVLVADRCADQATQALEVGRVVDRLVAALDFLDVRQQLDPQIRREEHRHQPGNDQRKTDDPEDIAGVLPGGRLRETHRHQADDRDQRACQHRRSGVAPGVGRSLDARIAFFEFDYHDLDGDDRVVHQQAQAQNQCAEGNPVERASRGQHHDQHGGEGQWHSGRHHDAHAPAQADQAHDHHHGQRDDELDHELVHGLGDVHGLVGDLAEADALGQVLRNFLLLGLQRLAQIQAVPAILHDHAEHQRLFAVVTNEKGGRVFITALDLGNVAQLQRTTL